MCPTGEPSTCATGLCAQDVFDAPFDGLGLCIGGCAVIGPDSGCSDFVAEKCAFTGLIGLDVDGAEQLVGECVPVEPVEVETGRPCAINPQTGLNNCPNGHICASVADGRPPECVQLCAWRPDRDACVLDGYRCVNEIFGGNVRFGACLP